MHTIRREDVINANPFILELHAQLDVAEDQNLSEICIRKPLNATALTWHLPVYPLDYMMSIPDFRNQMVKYLSFLNIILKLR